MRRALLLLLTSCSRCSSAPIVEAGVDAPIVETSVAIVPRCTDAPPIEVAKEPGVIGEAVFVGERIAIGMEVSDHAKIAIVEPDGKVDVRDLGPNDVNAAPPIPIADGSDLYVAHVTPARAIVVEKIGGDVKWEVPLEGHDDIDLDVAIVKGAGLVTWTFGDRVMARALSGKETQTFAKGRGDISSPRVLPTNNGFVVAYVVTQLQSAEAAQWWDKDAASEGLAQRMARGWIELVPFDANGKIGAAATIAEGRITSFDWMPNGDAIDVFARDAVGTHGAELSYVQWKGKPSSERTLANELGAGAPTAVGEGLVAFTDSSEGVRLATISGEEATKEPAFADARPLIARRSGPKIQVASVRVTPGGSEKAGVEVVRVSCEPLKDRD